MTKPALSPRCTPEIYRQMINALKSGIPVAQLVDNNRDNPEFPTAQVIYDYVYADSLLKREYTHAREMFADAAAADTVYIADTEKDAQKARNRIMARQWAASKIKPRIYGDKLELDVNNKIDVSVAIQAARRRSQVIEHQQLIDVTTSDSESDVITEEKPYVDPFS